MKLWQKQIFQKCYLHSFTIIAMLFLLYATIDLSFHLGIYKNIPIIQLVFVPFMQFSRKAHILIPFSTLVGIIYTLLKMNKKQEIIALLTSGVSKKMFFLPFFTVIFSFVFLTYANDQYLLPSFAKKLNEFKKSLRKDGLFHLNLGKENLVFNSLKNNQIKDAYLLKKDGSLIHAKKIILAKPCKALQVDIFQKTDNGYKKINSLESMDLNIPLKPFQTAFFNTKLIDFPPSKLFIFATKGSMHGNMSAALSALFFKIMMYICPIIILLSIFPSCTSFYKNIPSLKIYTKALIYYLAFFMLLKAFSILIEGGLIHFSYATWLLLTFCLFSIMTLRYRQIYR